MSSLWQAAQVLGEPAFDHAAGQEGRAVGVGQRLFLQGETARGMAGAAMAQALDQVLAAQQRHLVGLAGRGGDRRGDDVGREHPAPHAQRPAHRQRPGDVGVLVGLLDRLDAVHEVGVQGLDVIRRDLGVGGVRHRRVQRMAVPGHAMAHGAVEVLQRVVADARVLVGRDVGGIDGAQRRLDAQAAGEGLAVLGRVAGDTVAGARQVLALLDHLGVGRGRSAVGGPGAATGQDRERGDNGFLHHCRLLTPGPAGRGS